MEKIVDVKHLQASGFLAAEYTGLDLCDAFLMYWIAHNGTNKDHIVLHNGNHILDIAGYFKMFGDLVETLDSPRHHEFLFPCASVWESKNKSSLTQRHKDTKKGVKIGGKQCLC